MIRRRNVLKLFFICAILTTITNFPSGFTNSSVNTAVEELKEFINGSYVERGWVLETTHQTLVRSATLNCWFIAQIIGSLFSPFLTDHYGRKMAYLVSTGVMTLASAIQYAATLTMLPELLIVGRFMAALCSPLSDAALILYLQARECSPIQYRGMFSFLGEIGYCLMCVMGMMLGMRAVLGDSLTKLLGFSIIPGLFSMVFLLFIPETPKFLTIVRQDRQKALESLEFFQGEKKENERLLDDYMREAAHDDRAKRSSVKEIMTTWYLRHAVILACCVLVLTLSFYPILQSSTSFFQAIDIDSHIAELSSTGLMIVFTAACILGSFFIDRYPRRALLMTFGSLSTFFLALFVACSVMYRMHHQLKFVALGFLYCYAVCFGMVLGPMSWFVGPELVSQRHRSTVFCLCYGINNVLISVTNFATVPLYEEIGAYTLVPLFIVPSILCLVYLYFFLPETLGRETHEIIRAMRRFGKKTAPAQGISAMASSSSIESTPDSSPQNTVVGGYGAIP